MVGFRWSALVAVSLLLAGCGGLAVLSGPDDSRSEGRVFGFITAVDPEARTIDFDVAEWLTGEAAIAAALADGKGQPGEPPPNDYFIRNPERKIAVLHVGPDTRIRGSAPVSFMRMPPPCRDCRSFPVSVEDFFAAFSGPRRAGEGKYWVTIDGNRVLAVEELYTP